MLNKTLLHNNIILNDYCDHGNIIMWHSSYKKFLKIYDEEYLEKNTYILCNKCRENFYNTHIITKEDLEYSYKQLLNINKNTGSKIQTYYPILHLCINKHIEENLNFYTKLYFFRKNIKYKECAFCGKHHYNIDSDVCSPVCRIKKMQSKNHFSRIRIEYHKKNIPIQNKNKFPLLNFKVNSKGIIENYCKHGDLLISYKTLHYLYNIHGENLNKSIYLCDKCKEESDILSIPQIEYNLYKNTLKKGRTELRVKQTMPHIWITINNKKGESWIEKKYMFENDLNSPNKCTLENCNNFTNFNISNLRYNYTCSLHHHSIFSSKQEKEIQDFLIENNIKDFKTNVRDLIGKKELDIYIPDKKLAIEFNGLYWHNENSRNKNDHYDKWNECRKLGIKLLTIWQDDWDAKKSIIKSIIRNSLNISNQTIFARKTIIREINTDDKSQFLENNHLQGTCPSSINLGLFYNDELVSVMTFGKKRMVLKSKSNSIDEYELLRFCNKIDTNIPGGASKLFKYFLETYKPKHITSYANCDISDGHLYEILGFKFIKHTGINYYWTNNIMKFHRSNFMKHKLIKEGYDKEKTEEEIMIERGFTKLWGSGNLKYEWYK